MRLKKSKNKQKNLGKVEVYTENPDLEKLGKLCVLLRKYNFYYNFEAISAEAEEDMEKTRKAFVRFSSKKRLGDCLQASFYHAVINKQYEELNIKEVEDKLKGFEDFLDKKYWDEYILLKFESALLFGYAQTLAQAVELYESEKD